MEKPFPKGSAPKHFILDFTAGTIKEIESEDAAARALVDLKRDKHDALCMLRNEFNFVVFCPEDVMPASKPSLVLVPPGIQH